MPDQPADIQQLIADVLVAHRPKVVRDTKARTGFVINRDGCAACNWIDHSHPNDEGFAAHVAEVLIAELGLTREQRTLADGMGGVTTNYKTGETTVHSRPCTRQSRYVTEWAPDA